MSLVVEQETRHNPKNQTVIYLYKVCLTMFVLLFYIVKRFLLHTISLVLQSQVSDDEDSLPQC